MSNLKIEDIYTKFGGAVGNLNAHFVSYPNIDWITWSNEFIFDLNLKKPVYNPNWRLFIIKNIEDGIKD